MADPVCQCAFHHTSTDLAAIIASSIGIRLLPRKERNQFVGSCSLSRAHQIRSSLADSLGDHPHIWLSIDLPPSSSNVSSKFDRTIGHIDHVYFGALLSAEKFLAHDTPLSGASAWSAKIINRHTLRVECPNPHSPHSTICLSIPLKSIRKEILVIDGECYAEIILGFTMMVVERRNNTDRRIEKLYGNHPLVKSLVSCTEMLICMSPKSQADQFLHYFQHTYHWKIFYTMISIQRHAHQWTNNDLRWYQTEWARYALAMLHSLGYLFDDKYFHNPTLQNRLIEFAEENDRGFYQLCLRTLDELQRSHWLDLTAVFHQDPWTKIASSTRQSDDRFFDVSVVHLTPTRLWIMPKERTKGHRAMRYASFEGVNDFCLVYLKPDPPNQYLNADQYTIAYFHEIFQSGIELAGHRYHLFGASNSQLKDHSFWFIKATSLDDIHHKRQQLGQLDQIRSLGTYVARLGLWFSKTDPTGIKLQFCSNSTEFDRRVAQREMCVMVIDDIERNQYCFTDGNGLVSQGLAGLIAERLSLCTADRLDNLRVPSAYQIRIAGCKGLIIIDPQSTVDQFYIKIRPSMQKFQCDDWTLDICGYSRPTSTRLNNQFIWLLSDLGVPDRTFFQLQQRWFTKRPSCSNQTDDLKKNKIPLPTNECRYIYGCALESQLDEGQCFIRYQLLNEYGKTLASPKFECVRGRVIVTKNPCPYAGDMLELWAVDVPELHHLNDVIVFATRGERPDFNKIAGSDLDGDGYFVYWGPELRLRCQVKPLEYVADEKRSQATPISPNDVIQYCLSTLGATSSGEIYNLHAVIVDKNDERSSQRTCQTLAIELARMFSSAVDSAKTGFVIDKKRIEQIRQEYGKKYPDFLGKDEGRSYVSNSIVGKLYRNALNFINGNVNELEANFAQMNIDDDNGHQSAMNSSASSIQSLAPPNFSSTPLDRSIQLHPGSPVSFVPKLIPANTETSLNSAHGIPLQCILIDGMISVRSPIQFHHSTKPFYAEHDDLVRLRLELIPTVSPSSFHPFTQTPPSLSSLLFEQVSSLPSWTAEHRCSQLIVSFGSFYLLQYPNSTRSDDALPSNLDSLINDHFLPPLCNTFFPSTILERIEINHETRHCLQEIFYQCDHRIKREFVESNTNSIFLVFPWFKMTFVDHQREIIVICLNTKTKEETRIHFDKNGRIQSMNTEPKILFKCFHQENASYRPDILYELRSQSTLEKKNHASIFKHETLLDPTHPLSLPFHDSIVPIVAYSVITNIFQYDSYRVHSIRIHPPVHYKDDDFYPLRCTWGYLEQHRSVEIHMPINPNETLTRDRFRFIVALAKELNQMLD